MLLPLSQRDTVAVVPANLSALLWATTRADRPPMDADVRLTREGTPSTVVPTSLAAVEGNASLRLVRPAMPWTAGERYTLTAARLCMGQGVPAEGTSTSFVVGPAVPMPTSLGTLTVGELEQAQMTVPPDSFNGSCGTEAEVASRSTTLTLSPGAAAWSGFLLIELLVDGRPRGLPRLGDGTTVPYRNFFDGPDQLPYVVCDERSVAAAYGVTAGAHRLQFRARVVGESNALLSNEVTAEFSCGPIRGDGGVARDASATVVDAAPTSDVPRGADAGAMDAGGAAPMGGGGCAVAPRTALPRPSWAWIVAGLALLGRVSAASGARRRPRR